MDKRTAASSNNKYKRVMYPNPITKKNASLKIKKKLIEESDEFPVAITVMHENTPLTLFIDSGFKVRGVEKSVLLGPENHNLNDDKGRESISSGECEGQDGQSNFGRVLVLGLSEAGKTSIIKRLSEHYFDRDIQPTLGTNVMKVVLENTNFVFYDMGGQKNLRERWTTSVSEPEAIIFVIDTTSGPEQIQEVKKEFDKVIYHFYPDGKNHSKIPLLILGNKIDVFVNKDISIDSIMRAVFNVVEPDRFKGLDYHVGLVSALTGQNLTYNFKWLISEKIKLTG